MKYPLFQLLAICAQFCAAEEQVPQATASEIIPKDNQAPACADPAGKPYFPKGRESYYAEYYRAANLPSLQDLHLDKGEVRFRVAFLPSFSKPLFLTYARDKDSGLISIARLSGRLVEGEQPGKVELQGAVRMKPKVAEAFEKLAAWPEVREPLKALDERLLPLYKGLDGEEWILEVVTSEGYTMVDIQNPTEFKHFQGEFRKYFEQEIRKHPQEHNLPESFKKYDLPDLNHNVHVFTTFCEDLLKVTDINIPRCREYPGPTFQTE